MPKVQQSRYGGLSRPYLLVAGRCYRMDGTEKQRRGVRGRAESTHTPNGEIGHKVYVCDSKESIDAVLDDYKNGRL